MFRAIAKLFRAVGYLLIGRIDDARQALSMNPNVIRATFDNVIDEKRKRIQQYKDAVAAMIAQDEKKKAELKRQSEEAARLQQLRDGALAMARSIAGRHGGDAEAVKQDADYLKCQSSYKDFSSTLAEKEARCRELEEDIKTLDGSVANHKTQLEALLRELERLQQEKHETVADILTAREEKEVSDMLAGISQDRTSQELQDLRDLRQQARAGARVSRELAGVDTQRSEQEFLKYATQSAADSEFEKLVGLGQETPPKAAVKILGPEK